MEKQGDEIDAIYRQEIEIVVQTMYCMRDKENREIRVQRDIRFILAVEFTCPACAKQVLAKITLPEEKIVCPNCQRCETTFSDTFEQLLKSMRRPTPHRRASLRPPKVQTSKGGRPPLNKVTREKTEMTLHPDTLDVLYELRVSRGQLFEFLLKLFPPYTKIIKDKQQQ